MENYKIVLQVIHFFLNVLPIFSNIIMYFLYLQCPGGTVVAIYGFIISPNNLYKGLNMASRHDADDKSYPKSSVID